MELKSVIIENINHLLQSSKDRNITQGRLVCERTIESLQSSESEKEIKSHLKKLNHAFIGIEAHGSLTTEEFIVVKKLREIENND